MMFEKPDGVLEDVVTTVAEVIQSQICSYGFL